MLPQELLVRCEILPPQNCYCGGKCIVLYGTTVIPKNLSPRFKVKFLVTKYHFVSFTLGSSHYLCNVIFICPSATHTDIRSTNAGTFHSMHIGKLQIQYLYIGQLASKFFCHFSNFWPSCVAEFPIALALCLKNNLCNLLCSKVQRM